MLQESKGVEENVNVWELLLAVYIASTVVMFFSMNHVLKTAVSVAKNWVIDQYNIELKDANFIFKQIKDFSASDRIISVLVSSLVPGLNLFVVFDYGFNSQQYEAELSVRYIKKIEEKYHDKLVMVKQAIDDINEKYGEKENKNA